MDVAAIAQELEYWLAEVSDWTCTCGGGEMLLCNRCFVATSLEAAVDHVARGDCAAAYRATRRAAGIDGRLQAIRDQLEERAFAPQGARSSSEGGPADDHGLVDAAVGSGSSLIDCTAEEHAEIVADAIRREAELEKIGQHHDDRRGLHLQLANHPACGSTLASPLPFRSEVAQ